MMNFPFPGNMKGDFTVESEDVRDESGVDGYVYGVQMVLSGSGGVQDMKRALKAFFSQYLTNFSGYGNPYQLWFRQAEIGSLSEKRYAVNVKGSGMRVYLEPELRRFLQYLNKENQLATPSDAAAQETLEEAYLEQYRLEIKRLEERYNRKVANSLPGE